MHHNSVLFLCHISSFKYTLHVKGEKHFKKMKTKTELNIQKNSCLENKEETKIKINVWSKCQLIQADLTFCPNLFFWTGDFCVCVCAHLYTSTHTHIYKHTHTHTHIYQLIIWVGVGSLQCLNNWQCKG